MTNEELGNKIRGMVEKDIREKERHRIAGILGCVANAVFQKQAKEYPSNVFDVLNAWLRDYTIGAGHNEIEKWFLAAVEDAQKKIDKDGNYIHSAVCEGKTCGRCNKEQ